MAFCIVNTASADDLDGLTAPELRAQGYVALDDTFDMSSKKDIGPNRIAVKRNNVLHHCILAPPRPEFSVAAYYCKPLIDILVAPNPKIPSLIADGYKLTDMSSGFDWASQVYLEPMKITIKKDQMAYECHIVAPPLASGRADYYCKVIQ